MFFHTLNFKVFLLLLALDRLENRKKYLNKHKRGKLCFSAAFQGGEGKVFHGQKVMQTSFVLLNGNSRKKLMEMASGGGKGFQVFGDG
jgi:hypothetical protein